MGSRSSSSVAQPTALGADPGEQQAMAGDGETRPALDRGCGGLDKTARNRSHRPAALAADVLVVRPGWLVPGLSVSKIDSDDRTLVLEPPKRSEHRGEVR